MEYDGESERVWVERTKIFRISKKFLPTFGSKTCVRKRTPSVTALVLVLLVPMAAEILQLRRYNSEIATEMLQLGRCSWEIATEQLQLGGCNCEIAAEMVLLEGCN